MSDSNEDKEGDLDDELVVAEEIKASKTKEKIDMACNHFDIVIVQCRTMVDVQTAFNDLKNVDNWSSNLVMNRWRKFFDGKGLKKSARSLSEAEKEAYFEKATRLETDAAQWLKFLTCLKFTQPKKKTPVIPPDTSTELVFGSEVTHSAAFASCAIDDTIRAKLTSISLGLPINQRVEILNNGVKDHQDREWSELLTLCNDLIPSLTNLHGETYEKLSNITLQ